MSLPGNSTTGDAKGRILVCVENAEQDEWLRTIPWARAGLEPRYLGIAEVVPRVVGDLGVGRKLPDLAVLGRVLDQSQPEACFVVGSGSLARFAVVTADLLGLPVFCVANTAEDLENAGRRHKARPDLFFVGDPALLPSALEDARYGITMIAVSHPAASQDSGSPALPVARDPAAAERVATAIALWRRQQISELPPELSIIVPCYNEEKNVSLVVGRLCSMLERSDLRAEILLVDDASRDGTYSAALGGMVRSPAVRALTKQAPRGMGNAIQHGLRSARGRFIAVTMGDGSDDIDRIPEMFRRVRDEGFGLAIGSRYRLRANFENVPRLYRFWSACFRIVTRALIGFKARDYTNAFRLFDRRIFARYGLESGGFEVSPEISFKAWFATRRVIEVDVKHLKRASGQSSFSFARAGPGYAKILFKAFVNRLTGRWFTLDW